MAAIDLPTMIDFSLKIANATNLTYVGHSQGTIMGFAGFPQSQQLSSHVSSFIALAPVAYVNHQESPLLHFLAKLDIGQTLELLGEKRFLDNDAVPFFLFFLK